MKAVVVGGGIGGLAAAIGLRRIGADVVVFERAPQLDPIGGGLGLAANAVAGLDRLGVADAVRSAGAPAQRVQIRTRDGELLTEVRSAAIGGEFLGVHRGDLQSVLLEAVGRDSVRAGSECVGFRSDNGSVVAELADGGAEAGDVLVAADGIRSRVRTGLFGEAALRYAGSVGWRAVTEFDEGALAGVVSESWGRGERFGLVPIGGGRLYWFVDDVRPRPAEARLEGRRDEFLERFGGWHEPIREVIASTPEGAISGIAVEDLPPLPRWGEGRVVLLGDAAHAMTPDISQGAAQAVEDAVVLAASLAEAGAPDGLRLYERRRRKRAAMVVARSRAFGRIARRRGRIACRFRDWAVKASPARLQRAQQQRILRVELPELP